MYIYKRIHYTIYSYNTNVNILQPPYQETISQIVYKLQIQIL